MGQDARVAAVPGVGVAPAELDMDGDCGGTGCVTCATAASDRAVGVDGPPHAAAARPNRRVHAPDASHPPM